MSSELTSRTTLFKWTGSIVFLLAASLAGWQMLTNPLWGWWALVFNLSIWLFAIMFFFPKDQLKLRWLALSTLSGVLLGIGFPPSLFTFFVFIAWIPLLIVEQQVFQHYGKVKPGKIFLYALHAFALWNVIATFWVTNTAFIAGIIANFINAVLMAAVVVLIHVAGRRLPYKYFFPVFISFWIGFEYLHHFWDISWPWLALGNSMAEYPWAIQWYEYTGMFGGSFYILLLNVLGYSIYKRKMNNAPLRISAYLLTLVIPLAFSILLGYTTKPSTNQPINVAVVQPNFEPHFEKFNISQTQQALRFIDLSEKILDSNIQYLVYPETSFEGIRLNTFREHHIIQSLQILIDKYPDLHLITGLSSFRVLSADEAEEPNVRVHTDRNGEITYWDVQNSAVQMISGMQGFDVYFKSKFVPGPEIFPFKKFLFFLRPIVDKLGGSYEGNTSQETRSVFEGPLAVAPVICYESVYGDYTGGYVRNGATSLFIVTNDGWWDNTPGHKQHLKIGALRAIEHRRPIARSANTGISCFIDIKGRIIQPTPYGVATAIKGAVIPETRLTFYTKFGDLIAMGASIVAVILLLASVILRFKKKNIPAS